MSIKQLLVGASGVLILVTGCYSPAESKSASANIDAPPVDQVGRFSLVTTGDRVVKLDSQTGKAWVLEAKSHQWQRVSDDRVGKYNQATGKIEWEDGSSGDPAKKRYFDEAGNEVHVITDSAEALGVLKTPASSATAATNDPLGLFTPEENAKRAKRSSAAAQRGIAGLQLGMKIEDIARTYKVKAQPDPVAKLLTKYGKPEQGDAAARTARAIQKGFFAVVAGASKLPDGVGSADVRTFQTVVYQIALHYSETAVKRIGWRGVAARWVAKLGAPSRDTGDAYIWEDTRTRIELTPSGSIINLFFTDIALEAEVEKAERDRV